MSEKAKIGVEIEKKYIIKMPDISFLEKRADKIINITQSYTIFLKLGNMCQTFYLWHYKHCLFYQGYCHLTAKCLGAAIEPCSACRAAYGILGVDVLRQLLEGVLRRVAVYPCCVLCMCTTVVTIDVVGDAHSLRCLGFITYFWCKVTSIF